MEGNAQQSEEKRETHPVSGVVVTPRDVPVRVPTSVLGCTIAATVNAGFVLAFVIAYIVVRKAPKTVNAANQVGSDLPLSNNSALKAVITLPAQIAVLIVAIAALLALLAEQSEGASKKQKLRSAASVLWAVSVAPLVVAVGFTGWWVIVTYDADSTAYTQPIYGLVLFAFIILLFGFTLALAILSYVTKYGRCDCCCPGSVDVVYYKHSQANENETY